MEKHFLICRDQDTKISKSLSETQFYLGKLFLAWSMPDTSFFPTHLLLYYILYHRKITPFLSHPRVQFSSDCPRGQQPLFGPAAHLKKPQVLICTLSTAQSRSSRSGESRGRNPDSPKVTDLRQVFGAHRGTLSKSHFLLNTTKARIARCTPAAPRTAQF